MQTSPPILNYNSANANPKRLVLEETGEAARVVFPVLPKWVFAGTIFLEAFAGVVKAAMAIWIAVSLQTVLFQFRTGPVPNQLAHLRHLQVWVLASALPEAVFWWALAGYQWWKLRRFGRVPRVLTADSEGLVLKWLGWRCMRERRWAAADLAAIEVRPLNWNLNWSRTAADLIVRCRN